MQTRYVDGITIRPLRNGDVGTVAAVLRRLGPLSRAQRFGGPKPRVPARELELLARVDGRRHALVAWVDGDPEPAALAQLVREGSSAELAFAVADVHQGRGIGSTLADALAADALAAGITELRATVTGDNPRVVSLLRRVTGSVRETWLGGGQRELVLRLER
jgi:ribosomal protein S18 acetylase RimI-like enzyme